MSLIKNLSQDNNKKPTRYYSDLQEKSVAKAVAGKQTKNSGATAFQKGDVLTDLFLCECKTKMTHSDSITIKKEWFEKNLKETLITGQPYSTVVFNFGPGEENHYIIDEYLFLELIEYLSQKN